jgi:uncharacterized protein with HEPN domain
MIGLAHKLLACTGGLDQTQFISSGLNHDAKARNLELIGEAATRIPESVRTGSKDIPWRQVVATRKRPIHAYPGIDNDTPWSIVVDDIPPLLTQLPSLKNSLSRAA